MHDPNYNSMLKLDQLISEQVRQMKPEGTKQLYNNTFQGGHRQSVNDGDLLTKSRDKQQYDFDVQIKNHKKEWREGS